MEQAILSWLSAYGAPALFVLLALGVVGLPVPDESLLALTGMLIGQGRLHPVPAVAAAVGGAISGITVSYALGRYAGLPLITRYGSRLHINMAIVARVADWFDATGKWLLIVGYFIPGVRHVTGVVAGASMLPVRAFVLYAYTGAILWSCCFLTLGYVVGDRWRGWLTALEHHRLLAAATVAVLAGAYFYFFKRWRSR